MLCMCCMCCVCCVCSGFALCLKLADQCLTVPLMIHPARRGSVASSCPSPSQASAKTAARQTALWTSLPRTVLSSLPTSARLRGWAGAGRCCCRAFLDRFHRLSSMMAHEYNILQKVGVCGAVFPFRWGCNTIERSPRGLAFSRVCLLCQLHGTPLSISSRLANVSSNSLVRPLSLDRRSSPVAALLRQRLAARQLDRTIYAWAHISRVSRL